MQMVAHHVLPLALPGMLTGTIIGMARALGETAPLLMIGMVAFIVDIPAAFTDPSTGEFKLTELSTEADLLSEISRIAPAELLVQENCAVEIPAR